MLHHLAFQALAAVHPSSAKYDHFVGMFANVEVIPPEDSTNKKTRLRVQVDHLFTGLLNKAKEYFQEDEMTTVAMQSFLEERQKCRAAGSDRIAALLFVPALAVVRFIPIIV